jgi:hypothetical protein
LYAWLCGKGCYSFVSDTFWVRDKLWVFGPRLSMVGWISWQKVDSLKWSHKDLVCYSLQKSVGTRIEFCFYVFLLKNCQFHLTIGFSKVVECCFHSLWLGHSPLHKLDQFSILPLPHQAEVKCSLRLFGHQFFWERGGQSADQLHWSMWFHPE